MAPDRLVAGVSIRAKSSAVLLAERPFGSRYAWYMNHHPRCTFIARTYHPEVVKQTNYTKAYRQQAESGLCLNRSRGDPPYHITMCPHICFTLQLVINGVNR